MLNLNKNETRQEHWHCWDLPPCATVFCHSHSDHGCGHYHNKSVHFWAKSYDGIRKEVNEWVSNVFEKTGGIP